MLKYECKLSIVLHRSFRFSNLCLDIKDCSGFVFGFKKKRTALQGAVIPNERLLFKNVSNGLYSARTLRYLTSLQGPGYLIRAWTFCHIILCASAENTFSHSAQFKNNVSISNILKRLI